MKRCAPIFLALLFTSVFLSGCATTNQASKPPEKVVQSYQYPVFQPLAKTKQSQNKGGLEIFVAPVNYEVKWKKKKTVENADPGLGQALLAGAAAGANGSDSENKRYVKVERTPVPSVKPDRLRFVVRINNQMPRVFRGAGTVVQFNVNGQLKGVDQKGYRNLVQAIVPPRSQKSLEIYGPKLSNLPDKANIGLFFYDVVTKQNEAGEVTERQNFEWYYEYTSQTRSDTVTVESKKGWVTVNK